VAPEQKKDVSKELARLQYACKYDLEFLYREICGYDRFNYELHGAFPGDEATGKPCGLAYFLEHSGPRKQILIPRNHLKSTEITIVWNLQQILRNFDIRVCVNNAKYDTAQEFVQTVQSFLEPEGKLSKIFGNFRSPKLPWNRDSFTIAQRTLPRAQPTVMAASIDSILNGKHFDLIINDDLVEPNNVRTKEQIQKTIEFFKDCFNQIDKGGTIVNVGTRWAAQDLYGHVLATAASSINGKPIKIGEGVEWYKHVGF
jgi:hypothetical protein